MISVKNNNGSTLVIILLLMPLLIIFTYSMLYIMHTETVKSNNALNASRALYIAEAGAEMKILDLRQSGDTSYICSKFAAGAYSVTASSSAGNKYVINSTGYIPSTATYKHRKQIEVKIKMTRRDFDYEGIAMRSLGPMQIDSDIIIRGGLYSNDQIVLGTNITLTDSEPGAGDGQIRSAYELVNAVTFDDDCIMSGSDPKVYTNGVITDRNKVTGDNLDNPQDFIEGVGTVEPLAEAEWPYFDVDAVLDGTQAVYNGTPENIAGAFDLSAGNGIHEFRGGVYFNEGTVLTGSGTIIVTGGNGNYGIEMDNTIGSEDSYVAANLIVTDGIWIGKSIYLDKDVYIAGAMIGSSDIYLDQNVHLRGTIDCKRELSVDADVIVEYAAPVFGLPGYVGGEVSILSWREVN